MSDSASRFAVEQYRDAGNLNARVRLHERFSANRYGWAPWVFDQLDLPAEARVLELGCGTARLWADNLARVPDGWEIVLSDFSAGMLRAAQRSLASSDRLFGFLLVDAEAIPFADGHFDAVVANHMLYHVPDGPGRARALAEIRRVLRAGGRFYASTIGDGHLRELNALIDRFAPDPTEWARSRGFARGFCLQNGGEQLAKFFPTVEVRAYADELRVTEAEPLVEYVKSLGVGAAAGGERLAALRAAVAAEIAAKGEYRIAKESGLFVAS